MSRSRRWDFLYDRRPVPLVAHVTTEMAKVLLPELRTWPLPIQELDLTTGKVFAELLQPGAPRPQTATYREAFRLARWELQREFEAQDDYLRNGRYLAAGVPPTERNALLLIKRWLEEQLLGVLDATEGRIKRTQLVDCLDQLERGYASVIRL